MGGLTVEAPLAWLYQAVMAGYLVLKVWLTGWLVRHVRDSREWLAAGMATMGALAALTGILMHPPASAAWPVTTAIAGRLLSWALLAVLVITVVGSLLMRREHRPDNAASNGLFASGPRTVAFLAALFPMVLAGDSKDPLVGFMFTIIALLILVLILPTFRSVLDAPAGREEH
jgi:hypothetical protein